MKKFAMVVLVTIVLSTLSGPAGGGSSAGLTPGPSREFGREEQSSSAAGGMLTADNGDLSWNVERLVAPKQVGGIEQDSLALDSQGRPHIAYGSDSLYYARFDGAAWRLEIVDPAVNLTGASLALDGDNHPHISYYDWFYDDLKYAYWTGSGWQIETIDTDGDVGFFNCLALDSQGRPYISYRDRTNQDLKIARQTDTGWDIQTVDAMGDVGNYASLAVDSGDTAHIAYLDETNGDLKYARWTGSGWELFRVDPSYEAGRDISLALDGLGYPHISYTVDIKETIGSPMNLKHAWWTGATWETETIDTDVGGVDQTSLAMDDLGRPHLTYHQNKTGSYGLKYASWNGTTWLIENLDPDAGTDSSLALDAAGEPHVAYTKRDGYINLYYTHKPGATWKTEVVDRGAGAGDSSLDLDSQGYPHIAFFDGRIMQTSVARWNGSDWQFDPVDPGGVMSMKLDSAGHEHLTIYDGVNVDLKYAHWTGAQWQRETVASAGSVGLHAALALDSQDHPHIAYSDYTNAALMYTHWSGSAWISDTVDTGDIIGFTQSSLALDSAERPHIAYYDYWGKDLKYASWSGTAWITETLAMDIGLLDGLNDVALALDANNYPHVAYHNEKADDVIYIHRTGGAWTSEVIYNAEKYFEPHVWMVIDNLNRPHLSYTDGNRLLYAVQSESGWQTQVADGFGTVGGGSSLALDNAGRAHIVYGDGGNLDMKYAYQYGSLQAAVDPASGRALLVTGSLGDTTLIQAPAGAVTQPTTLVYTPRQTGSPPARNDRAGAGVQAWAQHAFDLEAFQGGSPVEGFTFQSPVTITIHYTDADVVNIDEDTLFLAAWDGDAWQPAACRPGERFSKVNRLVTPVCHLSRFALFGEASGYPLYLPIILRLEIKDDRLMMQKLFTRMGLQVTLARDYKGEYK